MVYDVPYRCRIPQCTRCYTDAASHGVRGAMRMQHPLLRVSCPGAGSRRPGLGIPWWPARSSHAELPRVAWWTSRLAQLVGRVPCKASCHPQGEPSSGGAGHLSGTYYKRRPRGLSHLKLNPADMSQCCVGFHFLCHGSLGFKCAPSLFITGAAKGAVAGDAAQLPACA